MKKSTGVGSKTGHATRYAYDGQDRVTSETDPLGHSIEYAYDLVGNLTQRTDRLDRVTAYGYDRLDELTSETWYADAEAFGELTADRVLSFSYDLAGRLTSASDPAAEYAYAHDALDRQTSVTATLAGLASAVELTSRYNVGGQRADLSAIIGIALVTTGPVGVGLRVALVVRDSYQGAELVAAAYDSYREGDGWGVGTNLALAALNFYGVGKASKGLAKDLGFGSASVPPDLAKAATSVPRAAGSADILGQVDTVALRRLQLGAEIEVPAGTQGIRRMMSDLSVVSGNEVALVRTHSGRRVLLMGTPDAVNVGPFSKRVIAHTHPEGSLQFSTPDIRALRKRGQHSSVIISPREDFGVRLPVPPRTPTLR